MIATILAALPQLLALIRSEHATLNPNAPPPTDDEIIAGLHAVVAEVLAKGDAWKAAHPPTE